ncbi:MAG: hypothetical protein ACKPE1_25225 [Dolichospermum sp.]
MKPTTVVFTCVDAVSNRQFTSTTVVFTCVNAGSNRQFTSKIDNFL